MRFPIAAMDGWMRGLTAVLLLLPPAFMLGGLLPGAGLVLLPTGFALVLLYAAIWLWARPTELEVTPEALVLRFPATARVVPRGVVTSVEIHEGTRFTDEVGWGMRVGAGGLWGAFGLLVCRDATYEMYVTRRSDLVVVQRRGLRPLLLSPADPVGFARALAPARGGSGEQG
jgi:hypothetical protein